MTLQRDVLPARNYEVDAIGAIYCALAILAGKWLYGFLPEVLPQMLGRGLAIVCSAGMCLLVAKWCLWYNDLANLIRYLRQPNRRGELMLCLAMLYIFSTITVGVPLVGSDKVDQRILAAAGTLAVVLTAWVWRKLGSKETGR